MEATMRTSTGCTWSTTSSSPRFGGCSKVLGIDVGPGASQGDVLWRLGRSNLSDEEWAARDIGPPPLMTTSSTIPHGEFCGQHTARFLDNGNVLLYDNGVVCAIDPWTFEQLGFARGATSAGRWSTRIDLDNHEAVFQRDHSLHGERSHLVYATGQRRRARQRRLASELGPGSHRSTDRFPDNEIGYAGRSGQPVRRSWASVVRELPSDERQRRMPTRLWHRWRPWRRNPSRSRRRFRPAVIRRCSTSAPRTRRRSS